MVVYSHAWESNCWSTVASAESVGWWKNVLCSRRVLSLGRALEVGTRADLHEPMRFVVSFQELWMTRRKFLIVFVSCVSVLRGSSSLLRGIFLGPVVMSSFLVWSSENSFYRVFQLFFFYTLAAFLVVIVPASVIKENAFFKDWISLTWKPWIVVCYVTNHARK